MLTGNDVAVLLGFLAAAITLAGFSGIVTAIDRSAAPASSEIISFRMRSMVVNAIYITILALLPVIIDALEVLPQTRWQFCNMIAAVTLGWAIASAISHVMQMTLLTRRGFSNSTLVVLVMLAAVAISLNIVATAGAISGKGAYFFALFHSLFVMLSLFYRIILVADEAARGRPRDAQ